MGSPLKWGKPGTIPYRYHNNNSVWFLCHETVDETVAWCRVDSVAMAVVAPSVAAVAPSVFSYLLSIIYILRLLRQLRWLPRLQLSRCSGGNGGDKDLEFGCCGGASDLTLVEYRQGSSDFCGIL